MPTTMFLNRGVYPPGATFFREGDVGDIAYIVQDGRVEITREAPDGSAVRLGEVVKGGIFGEMALIDGQPRMATARAAETTVVIAVSRELFDGKLAKADPFVRRLLMIFTEQLRTVQSAATAARAAPPPPRAGWTLRSAEPEAARDF